MYFVLFAPEQIWYHTFSQLTIHKTTETDPPSSYESAPSPSPDPNQSTCVAYRQAPAHPPHAKFRLGVSCVAWARVDTLPRGIGTLPLWG